MRKSLTVGCEICDDGDECYWCHLACEFNSKACERAFNYGKEIGKAKKSAEKEITINELMETIQSCCKKIAELEAQLSESRFSGII